MNELANGTEPLVLADGTLINPLDGGEISAVGEAVVEVPTNQQMQEDIAVARMRIVDLPMAPDKMNTLSVVLVYTLFGVIDDDIAILLHVPVDNITKIKLSDNYKELNATVLGNIIESDAADVRDMFTSHSKVAALRIVNAMESPSELTRIRASKDVLDRGGHRPADIIEHRVKVEGGLRIVHVSKDTSEVPTIDITPDGDF